MERRVKRRECLPHAGTTRSREFHNLHVTLAFESALDTGIASLPAMLERPGRTETVEEIMKASFAGLAGALAAAIVLGGCSPIENREDFAAQLKNKTEAEVLKFAGKPVEIDRSDPDHIAWIYRSRTFDVASRRTDPETDVVFGSAPDGKLHVVEVKFK